MIEGLAVVAAVAILLALGGFLLYGIGAFIEAGVHRYRERRR